MNVSSASGGRRSRRAPMAEINVTPFVDVMLVLLIIFMVTAPLLVAGVPVNLPESSAKPLEQKKEPIEVAIDQAGAVFIDGVKTPTSQLAENFAAIAEKQESSDEKAQILLRGDRAINYGQVVFVMGELNAVGLNQISLLTNSVKTAAPPASASDDIASNSDASAANQSSDETADTKTPVQSSDSKSSETITSNATTKIVSEGSSNAE